MPEQDYLISPIVQGRENQHEHIDAIYRDSSGLKSLWRISDKLSKALIPVVGEDIQEQIKFILKNKDKRISSAKGRLRHTHTAYGGSDIRHAYLEDDSYLEEVKPLKLQEKEISRELRENVFNDVPLPDKVYAQRDLVVEKLKELRNNQIKRSKSDFLVYQQEDQSVGRLKTLLYLHTVFADVFLAMFPESRRQGNTFCSKLSNTFAPNDILAIQTSEEVEAFWYKANSKSEINSHKSSKYDNSRYYGLNLHSLFGKNKTIEFRQHSGTLNAQKILYWVALHQEILDKIVAGKINIGMLRKGQDIFYLEDKIDFVIKTLGLRRVLKDYVMTRIKHFEKK